MKSDNSHTGIKKKQDNERQSFMYRKDQNRKNNADENFMENSETKSKAIDPFCHQLKRKLSDTSSNVNKESKRKKINPREYWTHSKIYRKSVPSKVNIQMKLDNSDTSIKKKQGNERLSFMYRKYQNRKNNTDENFTENGETKSKGIDPYCHQLKRKLSDTSSNVNKESKRKKINPREYWTHSEICKKSVPSKVNIQMKSDNSHTGIKKKQDNERQSFMYRKDQNRKNNADENFMENSETKSKTIDPFCHQLKRKLSDTSGKKIKNNNVSPKQFKHNKTNLTNKNVVCYGKSSKIKNVKMSQKCPLQKIMKKQELWANAKKLLREKQKMLHNLKMWRLKCQYMSKHAQLQKCLRILNEKTSHGPIYVCTICNQTWFRNFVYDIQRIKCSSLESTMLKKCSTGYVSVDNKVWLCRTCRLAIKQGKVPKLSIENGMGFPEKPHELDLHGMEERIISPRLLFFQMRSNILGGRTIVRGNVVNIAVDIAPTMNKLPRDMNELHTVAVTHKHKLQYKKCEFHENVRPFVVWRAAHYLVKNSCVFKENEVDFDTNWFAKQNRRNSTNN